MASVFNFIPELTLATNVKLHIQSIYVNSAGQAVGIYEDGSELELGSASDFPIPVTLNTTPSGPSVVGTVLVF